MRLVSQKQKRVVVVRRGEPQLVIMGIEDFFRTIAPEPEPIAAIMAQLGRRQQAKTSMRTIDREISEYRRSIK